MIRSAGLSAVLILALVSCGPTFEVLPLGDDLNLTGPDGKPFSLKSMAGKPGLVFFGYSRCPDWCPSTMSRLVQVQKILGKKSDRVWSVFVSVDHERDDAQGLSAFLEPFGTRTLGLTGTAETIEKCLKAWGSYRERHVRDDGRGISWDHGLQLYLVDGQGRVRALYHAKDSPETVARGLKALM